MGFFFGNLYWSHWHQSMFVNFRFTFGRCSLTANVFAAWRSGGFLAQKFNRRTALEPTTKLSYEALYPPLRQTAVTGWCSVVCPCKPLTVLSCRVIECRLCVAFFIFFWRVGKFFKNNFSVALALQALLKTLVVYRLVRFLIVLANSVGFSFVYIGGSPNSFKNLLCVSFALLMSLSRSTSFLFTSFKSIISSSNEVLT